MSRHATDRELIKAFRRTDQASPQRLSGGKFAKGLAPTIVRIDAEAQKILMHFSADEEYTTALGTVQGGIVATMLDFTMAFLVLALIPDDAATSTVNLNVSYLKPALPGPFRSEAEIERAGRTMCFCRARLLPQDGIPVATASGVFSIRNGRR